MSVVGLLATSGQPDYLATSGHSAFLAGAGHPVHGQLSLISGWLPWTVQAVTAALLVLAIGWRSPRWRTLWLPLAVIIGAAAATWAHWYIDSAGLAGEPAPRVLWIWVGMTGLAAGVALLGWRGTRWWRRGVAVLAVPLCALSSALALNQWVGYFPTVKIAWNQLTGGPLPDQTDRTAVTAMQQAVQQQRALPPNGTVMGVDIGGPSGFKHRGEVVYLPPAWYASTPPPQLPAVMMIGGDVNTPEDWLRAGNAVKTIDDFAAGHAGNAPVLVFVDPGGGFNNDTECVNGPRGKAADHLVKDVVPFMVSNFGVSRDPAHWGVVGWSMGGTCGVDLVTMHPDMFSAFVDIAGDLAPNAGTKAQTIARLFGGDAGAWARFDPTTVMTTHGWYTGVSGWFAIASGPPAGPAVGGRGNTAAGRQSGANLDNQTAAANSLCATGAANGIDCAVVAAPGKHDWPFAATAFASALPWLSGQIGTPGVARIGLPAPAPASSGQPAEAAGR